MCLPLLLTVLACATDGDNPPPSSATASDAPVATGPTEDDVRRHPETARLAPAETPAPRRAPPPLAEDMAGLDSESLIALFGRPSFVRRDPPAEIWQYRPSGCVLDLFLYPANNQKDLRVRHVAARGADGGAASVADCAARILAGGGQAG